MSHLSATRTGWENERLSSFLLSKLSFVAQPLSASDDVGTDFFCTLFNRVKHENSEILTPTHSFAIQIKSSPKTISIRSIDYYSKLELPYFVGVANNKEMSLTIYSAENLPMALALWGDGRDTTPTRVPFKLKFRLVGNSEESIQGSLTRYTFCRVKSTKTMDPTLVLDCPYVDTLTSMNVVSVARSLTDICRRAAANISSRRTDHNLYRFMSEKAPMIMAGGGSYKHFRVNFYNRLTEAFLNLVWAKKTLTRPPKTEAILYSRIYSVLNEAKRGSLPDYLRNAYDKMKQAYKIE